jgi:ketosteroid isomerase-like protein
MTSNDPRHDAVSSAARTLIDAFASNDTDAYFDAFTEDATFLFHTLPAPLLSRAAYREVWAGWQADGFAVLSCASRNAQISLQGELAIFMHDVDTCASAMKTLIRASARPSSSGSTAIAGWPVTSISPYSLASPLLHSGEWPAEAVALTTQHFQ